MRFIKCNTAELALTSALAVMPLAVAAQEQPRPEPAVDLYSQTVNTPAEISQLDRFHQRASKTIESYKPVYFAYGEPSSKIQFSFRSQIWQNLPINFGYTQIIFWELREKSKPFEDATYNPELFYRWNPTGEKWKALDFGLWEHNSNGEDGDKSRSYDQMYVRGVFAKEWKRWILFFSPKLRYIYNLDKTNRDIQDYIGPVDMDFRFVHLIDRYLEQVELILTLRPGGKFADEFKQGGYQIATTFKIRDLKLNPMFYVQYYHGYAETLINYNESVNEVRFGFMF